MGTFLPVNHKDQHRKDSHVQRARNKLRALSQLSPVTVAIQHPLRLPPLQWWVLDLTNRPYWADLLAMGSTDNGKRAMNAGLLPVP